MLTSLLFLTSPENIGLHACNRVAILGATLLKWRNGPSALGWSNRPSQTSRLPLGDPCSNTAASPQCHVLLAEVWLHLEDVELNPDSVTDMVGSQRLKALDDG